MIRNLTIKHDPEQGSGGRFQLRFIHPREDKYGTHWNDRSGFGLTINDAARDSCGSDSELRAELEACLAACLEPEQRYAERLYTVQEAKGGQLLMPMPWQAPSADCPECEGYGLRVQDHSSDGVDLQIPGQHFHIDFCACIRRLGA